MQCYRGMPINRINGQYFTSDTIQDQDARSKANISQLNIPHRTNKEKVGKKKNKKSKNDNPRSIAKQSEEFVDSVLSKIIVFCHFTACKMQSRINRVYAVVGASSRECCH